jgi:DNA-directed RNA polymerase subunit RPC12/RpoP
MIRYQCPKCSNTLAAQDADVGSKISCPHCGQRVQVPAPPPNKTMLGKVVDANKTMLGKLEEAGSPSPSPGTPPAVPRTILVQTALPADEPPRSGHAIDEPEEADSDAARRRRRRRRDYDDDDDDYDPPRRRRRTSRPCPRCGCTDYPRQTTRFGGASIALLVVGILFWPLLIVAFLVQEKWDVCPDCGEKLRQTGTGF